MARIGIGRKGGAGYAMIRRKREADANKKNELPVFVIRGGAVFYAVALSESFLLCLICE